MKAKLQNKITGSIIECHDEEIKNSVGEGVLTWVDSDGNPIVPVGNTIGNYKFLTIYDFDRNGVGKLIKAFRLGQNLDVPALGKLTHCAPKNIYDIEAGRTHSNLRTINKIIKPIGWEIAIKQMDE